MKPAKFGLILVRPSPLGRSLAMLQAGPLRFRAAIGRSGRSSRKREGDGATPIATMKILSAFVRRVPGLTRVSPLAPDFLHSRDGWCDAIGHASYNRKIKRPFAASHEEMLRSDGLYDVVIVLDWNIRQRKQGCGSAIFFHLIRGDHEPTAGCIAIARRDMLVLLPHLRKGMRIRVL